MTIPPGLPQTGDGSENGPANFRQNIPAPSSHKPSVTAQEARYNADQSAATAGFGEMDRVTDGARRISVMITPLAARRGPASRVLRSRARRPILWIGAILIIGITWQLVALFVVRNKLILPSFTATVAQGWGMFITEHSVYGAIGITGERAGVGFAISLIAIPLGLIVGEIDWLRIMVEPINGAMYSLPGIALVPLAIVWFGLGSSSKIAIVFLAVFFYLLMNTINGVMTVAKEYKELAQAYSSSRWHTFWTVTVPGSMPFIFTGLQLSIGRAIIGVIAAELVASNNGLGFLLSNYGEDFATADLFVIIAFIGLAGAVLSVAMGLIARRFDRWRET